MKSYLFFILCSCFLAQAQTTAELEKEIERAVKEVIAKEEGDAELEKLKKILRFVEAQKESKELVELEVALCNYLVEQACILEALDGRGVGIIKKELTANINDHHLSMENRRFLRRLVELCEETERSYINVNYVENDGNEAKADLLVENIGAGVGVSLIMGDVTPLISSAVRIGRGYSNINQNKSRQLQILIQAHKARITGFLFNVNSLKNDLLAEKGIAAEEIITPEVYREFLQVMIGVDRTAKVVKLREITTKFSKFKTGQFYLAEELIQSGKEVEAEEILNKMVLVKNPLLHDEGLVRQAYTVLAKMAFEQKAYEKSIDLASKALKDNVWNVEALYCRSKSYLALQKGDLALADGVRAFNLASQNVEIAWHVAKLTAWQKPQEFSSWLQKALDIGFNNFNEVWQLTAAIKSIDLSEVKWLLTPRLEVEYKPGIIKDDIRVINKGNYRIEKVKYNVEVRFLKNNKWEIFAIEGALDELFGNKVIELKNKFSMPADSRCTVKVVFSALQFPQPVEKTFYYNFEGNKELQEDWHHLLKLNKGELAKADNEKALRQIKENLLKISEKQFNQEGKTLALLADCEYELGNRQEAVNLLKKSLSCLKRDLTPAKYQEAATSLEEKLVRYGL